MASVSGETAGESIAAGRVGATGESAVALAAGAGLMAVAPAGLAGVPLVAPTGLPSSAEARCAESASSSRAMAPALARLPLAGDDGCLPDVALNAGAAHSVTSATTFGSGAMAGVGSMILPSAAVSAVTAATSS